MQQSRPIHHEASVSLLIPHSLRDPHDWEIHVSEDPNSNNNQNMTPSSSSSNSSNTTFHPFPRLPWELRARIWELSISPRVVEIHIRNIDIFKREHVKYWAWPLRSKLLLSSTPVPGVLHAYREARNHLTHPSTACGADGRKNAYYEKMSYYTMMNVQQQWSWQEAVPGPYVWVNFEIDMIDIGSQRFSLPPISCGRKIKRVKYISPGPSVGGAFDLVLPGEYVFPGVKEAEIECFHEVTWLGNFPHLSTRLVCGVEGVVCIDSVGGRGSMTLAEVLREWQERKEEEYRNRPRVDMSWYNYPPYRRG